MSSRRVPGSLIVALLLLAAGLTASPREPAAATTLILISFDGFRWDYHTRAPAPNLRRLMARGVRAERLVPIYPTKTFPNHYSIVTGLYAERHGIVGNIMREPGTLLRFTLADRDAVGDARWWEGEPIWATAERQGRRSATLFWPGAEAAIGGVRPDEWTPYDESIPNHERVVRLLRWLDLPDDRRPAFITGYFTDTDDAGHDYGPDSVAVYDAIVRLDAVLGELVAGIEARGLADRVNLVIVSDHGMAALSPKRVIALADYVDLERLDLVETSPNLSLNPRGTTVDAIHDRLSRAHAHLRVFRREETPPAWRYRAHRRIPAIVGVADEGWTIVRRLPEGAVLTLGGGNHGFDPAVRSMHGIFVAAGPAFRRGVTVPPFQNVHIYNALAAAMGITPAKNDGDPAVAQRLLAN